MFTRDRTVEQSSSTEVTETQYLHSWRLGIVIMSLFLGAFLIALDINIINIPIPRISTDFHSLEDAAWYGAMYLLTITAFQPTFGTLYKYFNIDTIYCTCVIIFEVGSVLCAAAQDSKTFIVGRAIAGLGAAGILQGNLAVIGEVVELPKRPFYMGVVISVFIITVCIGPILGGVFTQRVSWRWCFWINLPIGAFVLCLLFTFLRVPGLGNRDRSLPILKKFRYLDPLGCIIFIASITCLLLALQWGGHKNPWTSPTILGLFIGAAGLMASFIYLQKKRGEYATIPLRVFFKRSIWTGAAVLFFLGATTSVISFYIPFYFQVVRGVSPVTAGIRFIPLLLPQMVSLILIGGVVTVPYMILGEIICAVGLSLLTTLSPTTETIYWAGALAMTGFGMGMAMQLPYTAIQVTLEGGDIPIGNAIAVFSWQLGGAIAIPMGQTAAINTLIDLVPKRLPGLSGRIVIEAGAIGLEYIAISANMLQILRSIWSIAIVRIIYMCIGLTVASVPFTVGMEWLNAKEASVKKRTETQAENIELEVRLH